jgi:hypothetical protein
MTRTKQVVLSVYCLTLVYCFLWIPWCISNRHVTCERVGYGWLWAGPTSGKQESKINWHEYANSIPDPPRGFTIDREPTWENARPDLELMDMRLLAASAVFGAAFLLAGVFKSQQH